MSEYILKDGVPEYVGDILSALESQRKLNEAWTRLFEAYSDEIAKLWKDQAALRDEVHAVANRLEALTSFVVSDPAEVAAKIVNDANRATVTALLPTFPDVRCDECRTVYLVDTEQDGLITGDCPKCGHDRFSCTFEGTTGVDQVVKWDVSGRD